jgi:hypothetical protein
MMTLARSNEVVSDCISYCVQARDDDTGSGTASRNLDARQRLLERLTQEAALEADVGRALLALSDIFCTLPSEWATLLAPHVRRCAEEISSSRAPGFITEPLKTLLRLHLKIGKTSEEGCIQCSWLTCALVRSRSLHHRKRASVSEHLLALGRRDYERRQSDYADV